VRSQPLDATTALPYLVSSTGNLGEPKFVCIFAKYEAFRSSRFLPDWILM
jgi:hypothetical protein